MVTPSDRLADCIGFEWDRGNSTKNWESHAVSQSECEEVFFRRPLVTHRDAEHSAEEVRYYALGRTFGGRLLFVVFTIRADRIRVISARDMTPRERQRYPQ